MAPNETSGQTDDTAQSTAIDPLSGDQPSTPAAAAPSATPLAGQIPSASARLLQLPADLAAPQPMEPPLTRMRFGLFSDRLHAALQGTPIPTRPDGRPVPGGVMGSFVGAAVDAWGSRDLDKVPALPAGTPTPAPPAAPLTRGQQVLGGIQRFGASFGDIPVGKEATGGALGGVAQTMRNRAARLAGERKELDEHQKNQLMIAEANQRMHHEQALNHVTGIIDPSIAQGSKAITLLTGSDHPAPIVAKDITSDELKRGVIGGKYNMTDYTAFPTGKIVDGEDASGEPITRATYTVVASGGPVKLDQDQVDFLNKYKAAGDGQTIQSDQQLTFAQYANLYQTAADNQAATIARNKTLVDGKLATAKEAGDMEAVDFGHVWTNALTQAKNDPVKALRNLEIARSAAVAQGQPDKYPNLLKDVEAAYGKENYDKLVQSEMEDKKKPENVKTLGEASVAYTQAVQALRANNTPENKKAMEEAKEIRQSFYDDESAKARLETEAKEGDPSTVAQMLVDTIIAPSMLPGRFRPEYIAKVYGKAQELAKAQGKDFNPAKVEAQYTYAKNPQTQNTLNMISAIEEPHGSIDIVQDAAAKLPKVDEQTFNNIFNATATEFGSSEASNFHTAMIGLADEYAKVMGAGTGTDVSRQQALDLLKQNFSKDQMAGGIDVLHKDLAARMSGIVRDNPALKAMYPDPRQAPPGSQPSAVSATPPLPAGITPAPAGKTAVQIPGQRIGYINDDQMVAFKAKHKNALIFATPAPTQ